MSNPTFSPIAVVGRGCVLPGATSAGKLWENVATNRVALSEAPSDHWSVDSARVMSDPALGYVDDHSWSRRGGYVEGFDFFAMQRSKYEIDDEQIARLDPLFQWSLFAARQAMSDLADPEQVRGSRSGLVLGNLSYPSRSHNAFAAFEMLRPYMPGALLTGQQGGDNPIDPLNRFNSGMPAVVVAKALGIDGGAFALDAACASGLYAIKQACDRLQSGELDFALAGAVNAADPLFIYIGFCALSALSRTGQSRPFHREADGLVPAEGAAFVGLKRLPDAIASGDPIHGVIRGIGVSNDGRSGGFLSPAQSGQVSAIRQAFDGSVLTPEDISYIECHATGTPTGDGIEIASIDEVYGNRSDICLGSLKANIGHSITASGIAGLIKVLGGLEHGKIPGTPGADPVIASIEDSPFRVPLALEDWPTGPRAAAVSSFGFGGNNAHLLVEEWRGEDSERAPAVAVSMNVTPGPFAVVGMGLKTHLSATEGEFVELILGDRAGHAGIEEYVQFGAQDLAFPPADLKRALGQQLLVLDAANSALESVDTLDHGRSGIYVGMEIDPEICRYGVRWRLPELLSGIVDDADWLAQAQAEIVGALSAADVIGKMPNIPANRLNNQFDMRGPGFTISRGELSGDAALECAMNAITRGEIDSALVGAVDFSRQPAHRAAADMLLGEDKGGADAAVVMVLKALDRAEADGDRILGILYQGTADGDLDISSDDGSRYQFGHAYAASGLINIASAIEMNRRRVAVMQGNTVPLLARNGNPVITVRNSSFTGEVAQPITVRAPAASASPLVSRPEVRCFQADSHEDLMAAMKAGTSAHDGVFRLAIVGHQIDELQSKAMQLLADGKLTDGWNYEGIFFRERPVEGEIAFAFTGAASAYPGMGRDLLLGFPQLLEGLSGRLKDQRGAAGWAYLESDDKSDLPFYQLAGSTFLSQLHTEFSRGMLGIEPTASLGLSSGETNGMFAFSVWDDTDALFSELEASDLYSSELAGEFAAVARYWKLAGEEVLWENWRILAPVVDVEKAVSSEARAYLTIVNTDDDCVIGGQRDACERILTELGSPQAIALGHDLAVHCAAVTPFADTWRQLHTRPTRAPQGVRMYSNYFGGVFDVTEQNVAEALTGQALQTIDFRPIVSKAWEDGVRVFIEHGPRNSLSGAIDAILGDKPHIAVSLDKPGVGALTQAYRAAAELWCAGVEVDMAALADDPDQSATKDGEPRLAFALRQPEIELPELPDGSGIGVGHELSGFSVGLSDGELMASPPPLRRVSAKTAPPESITAPVASPPETAARSSEPEIAPSLPAQMPAPAVPIPAQRPSEPNTAGLLLKGHEQMVAAHLNYVEAQSSAQAAFMATMTRLSGSLFGGEDTAPADISDLDASAASVHGVEDRSAEPVDTNQRPGPNFSREQLITLAGGKISSVMGEAFAAQDQYDVQVRMPEPPLLLCDRVVGIEGEAGSMGLGTIWTETDVRGDSWYLHNGRMPAGIFIESGQADLLLISWLGVDSLNQGKRAYRLLGCELTFHGDLPRPGETLEYDIHVDGHANQGDVRLFFFHYDCHINGELRISVRNGQAGFFSHEELADSSGVLWEAESAEYRDEPRLAEHSVVSPKSAFSQEEVLAFTQGDLERCFGAGFYWVHTHTRTPTIPDDRHNFLGQVTEFDTAGGPAGRGYLRVETPVHADDWFFAGHFKNDPCMPGTLMAEATLQTMAFYLAATGHTLHRDGWRFQPVRGENYKFVCRGQVTPASKELVYELFVDEIIGGDAPMLFAHVLSSVDGRKAFLCERLGIELVPDWPLTSRSELRDFHETRPVARIGEMPLDYASLLHCAWGQPSHAFGPGFAYYDGPKRSPRLPGPPYHFMTRVTGLDSDMGSMASGCEVVAEYDVPSDAWYFGENGAATMPYAVLMEIGLQPCGWLASYTLSEEKGRQELLFRNLDGTAVQHREIRREKASSDDDGMMTITTQATLTSLSSVGSLVIVNFKVRCTLGDEPLLTMDTVFGFFPSDAMVNNKGLPISDRESQLLAEPASHQIDLGTFPAAYFSDSTARLPSSKLLMLDRITGYSKQGGQAGLGSMRAEKDVDPGDWFFKAHFFQDPVQPGSLGIEAMVQLIQAYMITRGMHRRVANPQFQPIAIFDETEWHYRGQVTPDKHLITVDIEVLEQNEIEPAVICEARLWADGRKIYHAPRIGMRIIANDSVPASAVEDGDGVNHPWSLSLAEEPWIIDHQPTYTMPVVPMTGELDMMARAGSQHRPGQKLTRITRASARKWMAFEGDHLTGHTRVRDTNDIVETSIHVDGGDAIATARLEFADDWPHADLVPLEELSNPRPVEDIYGSGRLFHGPAFHLVTELKMADNGATLELDLDRGAVPPGLLNPGMMDAALHGIPHDEFHRWSEDVGAEMVAYPLRIDDMCLFGPVPMDGKVAVEARFAGIASARFPRTHVRLAQDDKVFMVFDLVEVLMPKGPLGMLSAPERRAFLRDRIFVAGAMLSQADGLGRRLSDADVQASNWLPGTLETLYGASKGNLTERIAATEFAACSIACHPGSIMIDNRTRQVGNMPLNRFTVRPRRSGDVVIADGDGPHAIDWQSVRERWIERSDGQHLFTHDLAAALVKRFVRRFVLEDPRDFEAQGGSPVLYLANHETGVESFLFLSIVSALTGSRAVAIAKQEHGESWLGKIRQIAGLELGDDNPLEMLLFDRDNQLDMLNMLKSFAENLLDDPKSLLVHVEGTRSLQAGTDVTRLSGVLIDLAVQAEIPIMPVKFSGGLPLIPADEGLDFPHGLGQQDYFVGRSIAADSLAAMPYAERANFVMNSINALGSSGASDPLVGDPAFSDAVKAHTDQTLTLVQAVLRSALAEMPDRADTSIMQLPYKAKALLIQLLGS